VIIIDVQMPIMDGMMFTQKLRGLGLHQLPIIGLSGNATVEDREAAIASGMNDYLHKPVLTDDLIASIKRLT
jgi:CheY-like chemotaxis protein